MQLPDDIYNQVLSISQLAEGYFEKKDFEKAIELYQDALDIIPIPKTDWDAAIWLYVAIGDSYFFKKDFRTALSFFYDSYNGYIATSNPYINLRLGQCLFEIGNKRKAEDFLLRAYILDGSKIFKSENKKYLTYLKTKYNL